MTTTSKPLDHLVVGSIIIGMTHADWSITFDEPQTVTLIDGDVMHTTQGAYMPLSLMGDYIATVQA